MDWTEATEIVVARTGYRHYRKLVADDHPQREQWRQRMIAVATGEHVKAPPLLTQASNLAGALGRIAVAAATGQTVFVDAAEAARRLDLCRACHHLVNGRCLVCGCNQLKLQLKTEHCPLDPPRW